jgi:hypothetical protein
MKIVTWNMQGGQASDGVGKKRKKLEGTNISDALGLLSKGVDALLLQECGGYPDWDLTEATCGGLNIRYGWPDVSRRVKPFVVWYDSTENSTATHNRCSMAVISKSHTNEIGVVEHGKENLRPLIGIETADGTWIYSIHAPSGVANFAAKVADDLLQTVPDLKWVVAGDYNCSPALMQGKGYAPVASTHATQQSGNTLDFAIGDAKSTITLLTNGEVPTLISDHYSQCFQIQ